MGKKALKRAVAIAGSQSALAELIGTTQSQVWYWLNEAVKGVPAEVCPKIEDVTNGKVTCRDLRPDVFRAAQ